jgi:hypothetical protein
MSLNTAVIYHNKGELADECYTPHYAVDPLLEFIPKDKIIWCPFDEEWSAFYQTFKQGGVSGSQKFTC